MGGAVMLDAALAYARRSWPVFPLHTIQDGHCTCGKGKDCGKDSGKHPRTEHGLKDATTDEPTIRQWWARWPNANIGIATGKASGFFVIDVDPRHGGDDTLAEHERKHGPLPNTVGSQTGGGGRHILLKYPGYFVKSGTALLGPGLDIRADGGYIVAPGSLHLSGRRYEWEVSSHPDDIAIAEAPAWLLDLLQQEASNGNGHTRRTESEWLTLLQGVPDGQRYDVATQIAGHFLGIRRPVEEVEALILGFLTQCNPPVDAKGQEKCRRMVRDLADKDAAKEAATSTATPTPESLWPVLAEEALHGVAGEIVMAIDPYTEADRVAVLAQLLAMFGCVVGRDPHFLVEYTRHPAKLFMVLVGESSKARKGTSRSTLKRIFEQADPSFPRRMTGGLSSGEGVIWQVRDPMTTTKNDRKTGEQTTEVTDKGEADKRLLLSEEEFAQGLKMMAREGNVLSPIIRQAYDDEPLTPLTKNNRITATDSHIAIIGHITKAELLRHISETEMANGFCNRFIFLAVKRSKYLPNPKGLPMEQVERLAARLRDRIKQAHVTAARGPLQRDDEAEQLWAAVYPSLSDGKPGLTGAILGRGECHVMRLALTYALLDGAACIQTPHLTAALALWEYAEASARYIFGDSTGDAVADRIVRELRTKGPMSETELSELFGRHQKASRIHAALDLLERAGRIVAEDVETAGRTKRVWGLAK